FESLRVEAARLAAAGPSEAAFLVRQANWEPFAFVDLCATCSDEKAPGHDLCRRVQCAEWELLFAWCYERAAGGGELLLAEEEVEPPAAAHVRAGASQVSEEVGVGAAGVFQGVGQDRQVVVAAGVVDAPGHVPHQSVAPAQPGRLDGDGPEGVAEQLAEQIT